MYERCMWRYVLGVRLTDRLSNAQLAEKWGGECASAVVVRRRWEWLGHVLRMPDWRAPVWALEYDPGRLGHSRSVGGQKKSWRRLVVEEGWLAVPWRELRSAVPGACAFQDTCSMQFRATRSARPVWRSGALAAGFGL